MIIKTIIIDDEQHCIDTLQWQLEKYVDKLEILGTFNSPKAALAFLNSHPVDLVFLDIEMPEMNGFELLKMVTKVDFEIIFATAYDEFAIKAFNASAIDYLLKPINKDLLIASIDKVRTKNKPSILSEQMDILYGALSEKAPVKERIAVPTQEGLHFVKIAEIMYCTSDSNYTNIHRTDGSTILVSRTLKQIEAMLADVHFLRIHHSHLINLHKIERYIRGDGGYVIMDDKKSLSVSRSRKEVLLGVFGN